MAIRTHRLVSALGDRITVDLEYDDATTPMIAQRILGNNSADLPASVTLAREDGSRGITRIIQPGIPLVENLPQQTASRIDVSNVIAAGLPKGFNFQITYPA
jgi:hypothetical protein